MIRVIKVLLMVLIIGSISLLSLSCLGSSGATTAPATRTVQVQRGNIYVNVTGTGNLALKNKLQLSFGQTGLVSQATNAKISEVNVAAGQMVKKGDVLVKADTADWQTQLIADQHNLDSALASVDQAKSSVAQAQQNVSQIQEALIQDQADLVRAQQNLNAQQDVQNLQTQIDNLNIQLQQAITMLAQARKTGSADAPSWQDQITYLSVDTRPSSTDPRHIPDGGKIVVLQNQLNNLFKDPAHAGATLVSSATAATQIQQYQLAIQQAQAKITTDQASLVTAQSNVVTAQNNVKLAQNTADDAQTTLNTDKNSSQEIVAPIDGLITQVNVSGGQIVQRSATLIEIAEPNKYQANILVTETDSQLIKIGDKANLAFTALSGLIFPGQITQIAPLATVYSGVVNYQVTVELTSSTPISTQQTGQKSDNTVTSIAGVILRDGLSTTVTIPIQESDNVLIVPIRAVTRQGQNYTAQRVIGTTNETVTVQIGLSDGTKIEIKNGLSEGDAVVLKSTASSSQSGSGGLILP